ncbi:MAG: glucoamylase [Mycobacteriales bacterium]|jgi:glucoamylase
MTATLAAPDAMFVRAKSAPGRAAAPRMRAQTGVQQSDLQAVAQHMYALMLRNVASDGFQFTDPADPGTFSKAGCIIAAPSYPASQPGVDQDYVFNWTRDAAITAIELAAASVPTRPGAADQGLIDYVTFAKTCQDNATPTLAHACYTIDGRSRPWTEQSDGPALQTLAILQAFPELDAATRKVAVQIIGVNLGFLLGAYQDATTNLWEEHSGYSFFARAAQLRCLRAISTNTLGIAVPQGTAAAISWLESALPGHWDGTQYLSLLAPASTPTPVVEGYDPNIDIVQASIYGAIPYTDTRLLATAARLRQQWSDPASPSVYPINVADQQLGLGPLLGRYPADTYDGDVGDPVLGGHPWALCTCNFAELYYRLATEISTTRTVPYDDLSAGFFGQIGIDSGSTPDQAATALDGAADAMLQAVIYHSDNLELSEQFDGATGYEKSVRDLTWSYAAFLSAVRAKTARDVQG